MSSSTGMLRLILLALHGAGGRDQLLFRGDYVPNGNPMRTAPPGPSCWYPNYYCSVTEGNTQTPFVVTGGPSECYSACNADGSCKFFTWFSRRDVQYCYKLSECGSDYQIKDDWCLSRGPSCYSGPRDCSSIASNNANCTKLADSPSLLEWQCEDGGTGRIVNGYDQNLRAGTRCLLSCDSWTSHRWGGKSPLTYPHREKGYLFSECLADGTWSNVQTNDFTDGATELQFPSPSSLNLTSYPKPDEAPPSCGCDDLVLVWPPPGIIDLAVGVLAFTYNPRDEDGATMECEDEVQNTKVWADKEFRVISNNICRFLCDDYLTATVKCVDGKWTGQTERGFWCWNFPKWEDRLEDRTKNVLLIAGGSPGSTPYHASVEVFGRSECSLKIPDLPSPSKCLNTVFFNNSILACNGYDSVAHSTCFKLEKDGWIEHSDTGNARVLSSSVVLHDKFYILGGNGGNNPTTSVVMSADSPTWSAGPAVAGGLHSGCAVALQDSFVVIGGNTNWDGVVEYNPNQDSWTSWPNLGQGREKMGCAVVGTKIVVAGGNGLGTEAIRTTVIIDTVTKNQFPGEDLVKRRKDFVIGNVNGKLLIVGGEDPDASPIYTVTGETFELVAGSSLLEQELMVPRAAVTEAAVVPISFLDQMFGCP